MFRKIFFSAVLAVMVIGGVSNALRDAERKVETSASKIPDRNDGEESAIIVGNSMDSEK